MKLLDSCIWIEIVVGSPLGAQFLPLLLDEKQILVPALVQFEVRRWALRRYTKTRANEIILALREGVMVQTNERVALLAAEISITHKLHAMDAFIYATALEHDAELVTCDGHFKDLPQVNYTAKTEL